MKKLLGIIFTAALLTPLFSQARPVKVRFYDGGGFNSIFFTQDFRGGDMTTQMLMLGQTEEHQFDLQDPIYMGSAYLRVGPGLYNVECPAPNDGAAMPDNVNVIEIVSYGPAWSGRCSVHYKAE
ncbi:hypothetical protein [Bdellovibrio svalbardensis]|uniref:Secreted protein n=1 Tax=Bdellovibrio svalbardensis TaxID=2972972 RepID=A0ABT6DLF6_9BACT|nr:hypothetical protein [Bdellovibrio svalbardensis]MDG0817707.1 hypothetical protein [Bdellovibrio svalbardensis]